MSQASDRALALHGLEQGKITKEEYDLFIQQLDVKYARADYDPRASVANNTTHSIATAHSTTHKERRFVLAIFLILGIAGIVWSLSNLNNGVSGFATLHIPDQNYSTNVSINITQNITGLKVTGTMFGDGTANMYFRTASGDMLVGILTSDDGTPHTAKASYLVGEEVIIEHLPTSYNAYLDDGITNTQTTIPFAAPTNDMTLLLIANESDNLTTYRIPIIIGTTDRTTTFENLCQDTCLFDVTTGELIVETTGTAQVSFSNIETTVQQNTAPILAIPFVPTAIQQTTTIDLALHFADSDGDTLYYSAENTPYATITIDNNILTITPLQDGTDSITIYASDLKDITSRTLDISISGMTPAVQNDTNNTIINTTTDNTTIEVNTTTQNSTELNTTVFGNNTTTINVTETNTTTPAFNNTNTSAASAVDCSNPNPNERPIECVIGTDTNYFSEQDIYWYDAAREPVARFSTVGNLLITGDVLQHSIAPAEQDIFSIGYSDEELNIIPTIWIDRAGNLHLRGALHEEQGQIVPPAGSYSFNNKKGITLAYANLQTGDLYLRGNAIPYRKSVMS
jgi:hypothetical protein